jgi:rare lipoprotein A
VNTKPDLVSFAKIACLIVFMAGCAPRPEHRDDLTHRAAVAPQPPALDPATEARARDIAKAVEAKARRSEKAEGKQNLVKDEVRVTTDPTGRVIVEQTGEASWYGKIHHGQKTAVGQRFDQNQLTAAHPTLPLGTKATVTNLETGTSVDVIITDRGPYVKGRDIDLSKAAAERLGVTKHGAAAVRIDAVVTPAPDQKAGR